MTGRAPGDERTSRSHGQLSQSQDRQVCTIDHEYLVSDLRTAPSVVELVMWSTSPPGRRARKRFAHRAASDAQTACQPVDYSCSDGMTHEVVEHREVRVPAV
jgi:hypothetical protein